MLDILKKQVNNDVDGTYEWKRCMQEPFRSPNHYKLKEHKIVPILHSPSYVQAYNSHFVMLNLAVIAA